MFHSILQIPFTDEEHKAIQNALRQKLGRGFISQRAGAGGQKVMFFDSFIPGMYTAAFMSLLYNVPYNYANLFIKVSIHRRLAINQFGK